MIGGPLDGAQPPDPGPCPHDETRPYHDPDNPEDELEECDWCLEVIPVE